MHYRELLPRCFSRALLLFVVASLFCWLAPTPAAASPALASVRVSGDENALALVPSAQFLEDRSHELDLHDVMSGNHAWRTTPSTALSFNLSNSSWWIRLSLFNTAETTQHFVVDLNSARQDHVRWVVTTPSGAVLFDRTTGDRLPRSTRPLDVRAMAMPLTIEGKTQVDLYIRLQSHDGLFEAVGVTVSERGTFFRSLRQQDILLSVYFGALLALGMYNLFLYISTRAIEFGAYVAYVLNLLAWNLSYLGFSYEFMLTDDPVLNHKLVLISAGSAYAGISWFVLTYLRLDKTMPGSLIPRLYWISTFINIIPVTLAAADHYLAAVVAGMLNGMPMLAGTLILGIRLSIQGRRDGRFIAIAMGSLMIGAGAFYLELFGVVANTAFTSFGVQIGSCFEMLLLAFGLADSMNTLKAQKLQAEQHAHEAQKALAHDLEIQVRERTNALEKANQLLGEMAITDELTGAFNRRHFNQYCSAALQRQSRGEPLALCMFDIDHFKRYNDRYGHQAGDAVLRDVAKVVSTALKRSDDHLFRLGGEEFGVLFGAASPKKAKDFVESLRLAIRDLQRQHEDSPFGVVSASFGVAWWPAEDASHLRPEQMYATADAALYDAKHAGRDRVALVVESARAEKPSAPPSITPSFVPSL